VFIDKIMGMNFHRGTLLHALVAATAVAAFAPSAHASFLLDSGVPNGTGAPLVLNSADSLAGEFYAPAGGQVTELSAWLASGTSSSGTVTFTIYSNTTTLGGNFIGARSNTLVTEATGTAAFSGTTGWLSSSVNWTPSSSGYYWLALSVSRPTGLDAPVESSTSTGTVPALEFADAGSSGQFAQMNNGIGLEVTAVPLPGAAGLLLSGLGGFGFWGLKRHLTGAIIG
jgi:hypothetical protein